MSDKLRTHDVTLKGERVVLRPMTEEDWPLVHEWWNDPDIAYSADTNEGDYSLPDVQRIMRSISQTAFCFAIEHQGRPVGDCWLQEMNLERVLERYPERDCRRIDIEIIKELWGKGLGTEAIRLLADFGFKREKAVAIFGCDIDDGNVRSLRAFQKAGFLSSGTAPKEPTGHGRDVVVTRQQWRKGGLGAP